MAESVHEDCCELAPEGQVCASRRLAGGECPACGTRLRPVSAAHVLRQVLRPLGRHIQGDFGFCPAPACDLVFAGADGTRLTAGELRHPPAYKTGDAADLLCYCFDFRGSDFLSSEADEATRFISGRIVAGDCACDITNPSAGCCLGSIRRFRKDRGMT